MPLGKIIYHIMSINDQIDCKVIVKPLYNVPTYNNFLDHSSICQANCK